MCHFFSLFLFFIIFYYFYYFYSIGYIYIIQYTLKNYSYFTLLLYLFALFFICWFSIYLIFKIHLQIELIFHFIYSVFTFILRIRAFQMVFFVCLFCFLLQAHGRPAFCTSLCPRFLSHMKARPKDFCPPYYRSSKFTQQRPSSHGKVQNTHASTAPKSQMLQGEGLLMKHLDLSLLTPLSPQACSVAKASSHQACR